MCNSRTQKFPVGFYSFYYLSRLLHLFFYLSAFPTFSFVFFKFFFWTNERVADPIPSLYIGDPFIYSSTWISLVWNITEIVFINDEMIFDVVYFFYSPDEFQNLSSDCWVVRALQIKNQEEYQEKMGGGEGGRRKQTQLSVGITSLINVTAVQRNFSVKFKIYWVMRSNEAKVSSSLAILQLQICNARP